MMENEYCPAKVDNDIVRLAGWELSVSSTIDSKANSDQVIEGWNWIQTEFGSDIMYRSIQPFFILTVYEMNGRDVNEIRLKEPRVIEILRFSYWYLKVLKNDKSGTFFQKCSEIKGKLFSKALTNVEYYKHSKIDKKSYTDQKEFKNKVSTALSLVKQGKTIRSTFGTYLKELRKTLWSVNSELQFAGICQDSGLSVSFQKPHNKTDYDMIVEGIPCQVKSITTEDDNALNLNKLIRDRYVRWLAKEEVNEDEVEHQVKADVSYRYRSVVKSIDQGVRIVLINGTHSYSGFLANRYATDKKILTPLINVLQSSISLLTKNQVEPLETATKIIHVILGAGAIDVDYRYSALGFQIPFDSNAKTLELTAMKKNLTIQCWVFISPIHQ
jgi:hypothetical protein